MLPEDADIKSLSDADWDKIFASHADQMLHLSDDETEAAKQNEKANPGAKYVAPDGVISTKHWMVSTPADYELVPPGDPYIDPEGLKQTKKKYEPVSMWTQTMLDMSINEKERFNILAKQYGKENIRQLPSGELYVEQDGKRRKPGEGNILERGIPFVAGAAAPAVLGGLGAAGGFTAAAPTVVGAIPGAVAGGIGGSVLGQAFNDMILSLAGVTERTGVEEFAHLGTAGLMGAAGAGVGTGLKLAARGAGQALPQFLAQSAGKPLGKFLGADKDLGSLEIAQRIAEKGWPVPPSTWAKEAPYLHTAAEVFDPKFRTQNYFRTQTELQYVEDVMNIYEQLGIKAEEGRILSPGAKISSREAGESVLQRAAEDMEKVDATLSAKYNIMRQDAKTKVGKTSEEWTQQVAELRAAEKEAMDTADRAIKAGFDNIKADADKAMRAAGVGHNSGDLWNNVGEKLQQVFGAIRQRASQRYGQWEASFGYRLNVETAGIQETARQFRDNLPVGFKDEYPDIVKTLDNWAGKEEIKDEAGKIIQKAVPPVEQITQSEAHNLRTLLRSNVDYYDLPSGIRNGTYKKFASKLNEALHTVPRDAPPPVQALYRESMGILDDIDAWYGKNIAASKEANIKAVVSALESGLPADPKMLYDKVIKEGRSDLINKVRKLVGPGLWNAIKAADVQEMLEASKTLIPGQIDGKRFASEVLSRHRNGTLFPVHGEAVGQRLINQATHVEMLSSRIPVPATPADTVQSIIRKAHDAVAAAEAAAKSDPTKAISQESRAIEQMYRRELAEARAAEKRGPIGFIFDPSIGATKAADRILGNEDFMMAVAARWGRDSTEM